MNDNIYVQKPHISIWPCFCPKWRCNATDWETELFQNWQSCYISQVEIKVERCKSYENMSSNHYLRFQDSFPQTGLSAAYMMRQSVGGDGSIALMIWMHITLGVYGKIRVFTYPTGLSDNVEIHVRLGCGPKGSQCEKSWRFWHTFELDSRCFWMQCTLL